MVLDTLFKEISLVKKINQLRGLTDEFIQSVKGITSFSYLTSHYAEQPFKPHVITHYPKEWIKLYQEKNYVLIDPTLQDILTTYVPFLWDYKRYLPRLNEQQAQLFLDSINCGVVAGITCPLHGPLSEFGGVFFAIESTDDFVNNCYGVNQWDLMCFSLIYHETARRLFIGNSTKQQRLTTRETECLMWSSRGKTAYEIGIILGLSEQTIETYLKICLSKLNASNKTHAVTKALMQGYLTYYDIDWTTTKIVGK